MSNDINKIIDGLKTTPEPHRSKAIICYMSSLFEEGKEEEALSLIEELDKGYLKSGFVNDIESDENFKKIFMSILSSLVKFGYVSIKK